MVLSDCAKTILLYLLAALEDDMYCTVDSCKKMHDSIGTFMSKKLIFPQETDWTLFVKITKEKTQFLSERNLILPLYLSLSTRS